jgi:hypothetical protein
MKQLLARRSRSEVHDLTNEHVTTSNIVSMFGHVKTFKTINPFFFCICKKKNETIYWKLYGIGHITNNELMVSFVKGWIT